MKSYLRAMRLERWPRSAAIFLGSAAFFFLHRDTLADAEAGSVAWRLFASFLLTWAVSTANYIINEIVDAPFDSHHPTKRLRPLASGEIRKTPLAAAAALLLAGSLGTASVLFSRPVFLSLLALLLAGFIYNVRPVRTKDIPFLDAVSESANNPIRFLIGWHALSPPDIFPPVNLLVSWWAFGNFLMVAKRLSEFRFLKEKAADYRISHKRYSTRSLLAGMSASAAIFLLAFFHFALIYDIRPFFYISPFLAFYVLIIFRKTLREKEVMEEPEMLLQRPLFAVYTFALLLLFLLAFLF